MLKITPADREWYASFCNMCSANVLDRNNNLRFTFTDLQQALDNCSSGNDHLIPEPIITLLANIVNAVNKQKGTVTLDDKDEHILLLTLLNIHAAYLMLTRIWRFDDTPKDPQHDEYGFEIF